jgi:hypothetical protein
MKLLKLTAFFIFATCLIPQNNYCQENNALNSNKIIDSLYSLNHSNNLILISQVSFKTREKYESSNVDALPINTKESYGYNPHQTENNFLFLSFGAESLPIKYKLGYKKIKVSVSVQNKIIDSKSYFWMPEYDGNYYIYFPLENKYFSCTATNTNIKIDIIEDNTKAIVTSEVVKYETYCETD